MKNLGNKELKKAKEFQETINKMVRNIMKRRGEILEDFSKAYLAETKLKPSQIKMMEHSDYANDKVTWWFEKK